MSQTNQYFNCLKILPLLSLDCFGKRKHWMHMLPMGYARIVSTSDVLSVGNIIVLLSTICLEMSDGPGHVRFTIRSNQTIKPFFCVCLSI